MKKKIGKKKRRTQMSREKRLSKIKGKRKDKRVREQVGKYK